jgi:hypothetical protein
MILLERTKKRKSMANDRKKFKEVFEKPTFDKQMETYSEGETNADDPIFSSVYHKFMSNLLKTRDAAVKDELIEEVGKLFIENNKTILGSIDELLITQVATVGRVVGEVMVAIEGLDKKLNQVEITNRSEHSSIMTELTDLKIRQDSADEKIKKEQLELSMLKRQVEEHDKLFELKKKRIESLERAVTAREKEILSKIQSIDDEIHGEIPIRLAKWYKIEKYMIAILVAVLLSTLITFFVVRKHARDIKAACHSGNIPIEITK